MKKLFLFAVLSGMLFASCSQDELLLSADTADVKSPIDFTVSTQASTRAAEIYCNNNPMSSFAVWATLTDDDDATTTYINGNTVNYNNGSWDLEVPQYWPGYGTMKFYATNIPSAVSFKSNYPYINLYTVSTDVEEQEDLLYAAAYDVDGASTDAVSLNFRHALSQILFGVRLTSPGVYVEISEIGIGHVNNTASWFRFPVVSDTSGNYQQHGNYSTTETLSSTGSWISTSGCVDCVVALDNTVATKTSNQYDLTYVTEKKDYSKAILAMPQTKSAYSSSNPTGFYFIVKCCIYNVASLTYGGFNASTDSPIYGTQAEHKYLYIPADIEWNPGYKYTYVIKFGNGNGGYQLSTDGEDDPETALSLISFDVTIDDFVLNIEDENKEVLVDCSEYVDLGLSVYWAAKNLGAETMYDLGTAYACNSGEITDELVEELYGEGWRLPTKDEKDELYSATSSGNVYVQPNISYAEYTDYNNSGVPGILLVNNSETDGTYGASIFLPVEDASGETLTRYWTSYISQYDYRYAMGLGIQGNTYLKTTSQVPLTYSSTGYIRPVKDK